MYDNSNANYTTSVVSLILRVHSVEFGSMAHCNNNTKKKSTTTNKQSTTTNKQPTTTNNNQKQPTTTNKQVKNHTKQTNVVVCCWLFVVCRWLFVVCSWLMGSSNMWFFVVRCRLQKKCSNHGHNGCFLMVVFGTKNNDYDQLLVDKRPTNQQRRNCPMIRTFEARDACK